MYRVLLLWLCSCAAYCQTALLTGQLMDRNTKEPIPFAHFRLLSTNEGFISNMDGQFKYQPLQTLPSYRLFISAIGYQSDTLEISAGSPATLMLNASKIQLKELVIVPKDYERELLLNVIRAIPANYPDKAEQIMGEIWEKGYKDSLYTQLYYEATAKIEATKTDYKNASSFGPVRFLEGNIQTQPEYDDIQIRISAGIHNVHRFDFVLQRLGPLDASRLKTYALEIVDTLRIDDTELYDVYFEGKDYFGHLLIEDGSFAILRGEFNQQPDKLDARIGYERTFLRFTTEYTKFEGRYRMSYINYRTAFINKISGKPFYLDNVFSLTHFSDVPVEMPFNEQVPYTEILTYKLLGERNQQITLDTSRLATNAAADVQTKQTKKYAFLSKIYSQFGVNVAPVTVSGYEVSTPDATFSGSERRLVQYRIYTETGYKFSNTFKLALIGEIHPDFRSFNGLQARWDFPLNTRQTFRTAVGLTAGYGSLREKVGSFKPMESFTVQGEKFGTKSTELFLETRGFEMAPSLRLLMQVSPRLFVSLMSQYWWQASVQNGVYLVQDKTTHFTTSFLDEASNTQLVRHHWSVGLGINLSL